MSNPQGGKGGGAHKLVDIEQFCAKKDTILRVRNKNDPLCFAKAIIKALYCNKGPLTHPKQKSTLNENNILDTLAKDLYERAGVPERRVTIEDMPKFQQVLSRDYPRRIRIHVYSMRYGGTVDDSDDFEPIYLFHHDDHFDVIRRLL